MRNGEPDRLFQPFPQPAAGRVSAGAAPGPRHRIGFVAQDKPLYGRFTVDDMLRMGGWMNPGWDRPSAQAQLAGLDIPLGQRCGSLSGGERAQVSLAVALGKRPDLLLLDEPVANLDPLARRQFMQVLLEHVAATGMSVVLSSHLLADLERAWDYLVLLSASRVQLRAPTDELLHQHRVLTGPRGKAEAIAATHAVVQSSGTDRQASMLIRAGESGPFGISTIPVPPGAYTIESGYSTATGRPVPFSYLVQACGTPQGTSIVRIHMSCLAAKGFHVSQIYQPATRYWPLQGLYTASLTAFAVILLGLAAWWTTRRVS